MSKRPKILLSSVFGPFGVDDAYGRKENIMELFHNQVTREQGLFSLRFHHQSFGLYLIADNLRADTTVLDFPSRKRFVREIKKGYDYVGISFITPNFIKAKTMAALVRRHAPQTKIVLGGHGTAIPGIEKLIDADHYCRGEGVGFFRRLIDDNPYRPIRHPILPASFNQHLLGIPLQNDSAVLMPGVGCVNACRFCSTSHFFNREYTAYLKTGDEIFAFCRRAERQKGYREFFIMDENFLKNRERAERLVELMEKNDKPYRFAIFSSAETIQSVGVDFLARLGVTFLWLGMEGRRSAYEKNKGVHFPSLVASLRQRGIVVLGSVILFTEEHDKRSIHDEVDFAIEAAPDFIQFMQLGPLPETALYRDYRDKGLLRDDMPYEEWHGQHHLWFRHPHFTGEESAAYLKQAFQRTWDELGASLLRLFETNLFGYHATRNAADPFLRLRHRHYASTVRNYYPALPIIVRYAHNRHERDYARRVLTGYRAALGPMDAVTRAKAAGAMTLATLEAARIATVGNMRQPNTLVTKVKYRPAKEYASLSEALRIHGLPLLGHLSLKSGRA